MRAQDVIVIGGGPAGMTAASEAARAGASVLLLERNERVGRKLSITGKGRCNVTNAAGLEVTEGKIVSNPRFLFSALSRFSNRDVMERMERLGVPLKVERGGRVFPVSDRARDVADALYEDCLHNGVRFRLGVRAQAVRPLGRQWRILSKEACFTADRVVVATGGLSYPATGSTGDGYRFAKENAHTVTDPKPGLVPLTVSEEWPRDFR